MKTKEEILKMSNEELQRYTWSTDLDIPKENKNCSDCSYCSECYNCYNCSHCSECSDCSYCSECYDCYDCSECYNCLYCRNLKNKRNGYYICNIEVSKEEFENKLKEIKEQKRK